MKTLLLVLLSATVANAVPTSHDMNVNTTKAIRTMNIQAEQRLGLAVVKEIEIASQTGKYIVHVDVTGYTLHQVDMVMSILEDKGYQTDWYSPNSVVITWNY